MAVGITVKEALDLIELNGIKVARVIAGFGGLDNIINSVSVIEVPDATRWYRGNELQITAFYSIKDNVKAQVQVIERIARCNCAALILCHTGVFLKEVSQELIDAANYYKLPLIVVPAELAYVDIITPVLEAIIDKQKREIEYAFNVQTKMNQIILQGKSFKVLANGIADILRCPLLVIDSNNTVLARSPYNNQGNVLLNKILGNQELCNRLFNSNEEIHALPQTTRYRVDIRELTSAGKYLGKLLLFWDRTLSTMENIAANEACQALKLVLMQEMAKREEKEKARREFLDELLSGSIKREDVALSRAENFNLKVPVPPVVMIIEFESYETLYIRNKSERYREKEVKRFRDESIKIVEAVMAEAKFECIVVPRGNLLIVIFALDKDQTEHVKTLKKIGRRIEEELLKRDNSINFIITFGNQYPRLTDLHKSFIEALKTVSIARIVFNQSRCIHVTDLGIYYYLPELLTNKSLNDYIDKVINVIEKYDCEKEADLLETFKLLLFEDDIIRNVADKLYVHRNTLLNRKKKIQQLLGEDPFSHPLKLNYQLVMLLAQLRKKLGITV